MEEAYSIRAKDKLYAEIEQFKGDNYAKCISNSVTSFIVGLCEMNEIFAKAVYLTKRSISDVCYEIIKQAKDACKNKLECLSDHDVYKMAISNYFPGAEAKFNLVIDMHGIEEVSEDDLNRETEYPKEPEHKPIEVPKPIITKPIEKPKKEIEQLSFFDI